MKAKRIEAVVLLVLSSISLSWAQQEESQTTLRASVPGKTWSLEIAAPGFTVKLNQMQPDGRRYVLAENSTTHVILSVFLEQTSKPSQTHGCQQTLADRAKPSSTLQKNDIRFREAGAMAIVEYVIPEVKGQPINQKNLFACLLKDDVYVDIHLSKALFKPSEEQLFGAVLDAIRFRESKPDAEESSRTSMDYLREGSRYYLQQQYREAMVPYRKALNLEKKEPKLEKNLWRVLVDNLGMAYGITGNLKSAKETFEYGISKDPTYPMFYYNMACTYAEMNDLEGAMSYLKKAFEYRQNAIPGEGMPDPRGDSSFQRFLKNEKFRLLLDQLR